MKEALKLALEALNTPKPEDSYPPLWHAYKKTIDNAITAIEEALAQPEQEPVAWLHEDGDVITDPLQAFQASGKMEPLYTTPPQRKPLTDEEIYEMYNEPRSDVEMLEFARTIEAAHGIKE